MTKTISRLDRYYYDISEDNPVCVENITGAYWSQYFAKMELVFEWNFRGLYVILDHNDNRV